MIKNSGISGYHKPSISGRVDKVQEFTGLTDEEASRFQTGALDVLHQQTNHSLNCSSIYTGVASRRYANEAQGVVISDKICGPSSLLSTGGSSSINPRAPQGHTIDQFPQSSISTICRFPQKAQLTTWLAIDIL